MIKSKFSAFSAFSPYYFHVFSTFPPHFFNSAVSPHLLCGDPQKIAEKMRNSAKDAEIWGTGHLVLLQCSRKSLGPAAVLHRYGRLVAKCDLQFARATHNVAVHGPVGDQQICPWYNVCSLTKYCECTGAVARTKQVTSRLQYCFNVSECHVMCQQY